MIIINALRSERSADSLIATAYLKDIVARKKTQ